MQAVLLATGEQRKLPPLTDDLPPAMLPVGHQPVMAHAMELLAAQGLRRQVVCLHYQPAAIEAYFGGGQRWGVALEYSIQRDALGTAGALKWAGRLLSETFLVAPADVIVELDVHAALLAHRQQQNAATVIVRSLAPPALPHNGNGAHAAREHSDASAPACPVGAYIFEPEVLDFIPPFESFDIQQDLLPALQAAGLQVGHFAVTGYWNALASVGQFFAAQREFLGRLEADTAEGEQRFFPRRASVRGRRVAPGIWVGRNNAIHPSARLAEPVFIGRNCRIGRGVELGPNAIIGANVVVDDEATIRDSLVLDNTYVGKLVKLEHRLVAQDLMVDLDSGEHVRVADAFWLGETPQTLTQSVARRYRDTALALALGLPLVPLAALWGLAVLLATGRVFARRSAERPRAAAADRAAYGSPLRLLNFNRGAANRAARWLGHWQARLGIERWPELWNVLTGELALVGAKPLSAAEAEGAAAAWGPAKAECEPGFTGLWYVQTGPDSDLDEIVIADAFYAATRSWKADMQILLRTPGAWWRRARAGKPAPVLARLEA